MQEYLEIGQIVNTHGLKGHLKVVPFTDDINRFKDLKNISALYLTREIEKVYVLLFIMQTHIKYIMKRIYWNIVMIS